MILPCKSEDKGCFLCIQRPPRLWRMGGTDPSRWARPPSSRGQWRRPPPTPVPLPRPPGRRSRWSLRRRILPLKWLTHNDGVPNGLTITWNDHFIRNSKFIKSALYILVPGKRSDLNYGGRPPCHTQIDLMGWDISSVEGQMGKKSSCTGGSGSRVTLSDIASSKWHVVLIIFNLNGKKTIICDIKC